MKFVVSLVRFAAKAMTPLDKADVRTLELLARLIVQRGATHLGEKWKRPNSHGQTERRIPNKERQFPAKYRPRERQRKREKERERERK